MTGLSQTPPVRVSGISTTQAGGAPAMTPSRQTLAQPHLQHDSAHEPWRGPLEAPRRPTRRWSRRLAATVVSLGTLVSVSAAAPPGGGIHTPAPRPSVQQPKEAEMQRLHTFNDKAFMMLGFSERPPIPSWAQPKIEDWARLLAVVEGVERAPAALNRFKAEALVAGEWGLAPLPPPMTLEHADPEDSLIRSTPLDRYLPINWRLVSHVPSEEVPIKRSALYGFQMILNQRPLDAMNVLQASGLKPDEPIIFAHFAPDGRRAGLYIIRHGPQWGYVATNRWGETARTHDKHYFWFSGGLGELSHKKSNERFVSFDGIGGANCLMGADAIARAVERALQEKKP